MKNMLSEMLFFELRVYVCDVTGHISENIYI